MHRKGTVLGRIGCHLFRSSHSGKLESVQLIYDDSEHSA